MSKWDGKSKGSVLGYQIFVFCIKTFGVRVAYFILYFVATYYFLFLKKSNRVMYYYFHKRLGYSSAKARKMVYKNYFAFGQTLIDKIAIASGMREKFTYEFDGIENLQQLLAEKKIGKKRMPLLSGIENKQLAFFKLLYAHKTCYVSQKT